MLIAVEQGVTPRALSEKPELLQGSDFFMQAYQDLVTDRAIGMSVGPIPWSSVLRWGRHNGLDQDDIEELNTIIRTVERAINDK